MRLLRCITCSEHHQAKSLYASLLWVQYYFNPEGKRFRSRQEVHADTPCFMHRNMLFNDLTCTLSPLTCCAKGQDPQPLTKQPKPCRC